MIINDPRCKINNFFFISFINYLLLFLLNFYYLCFKIQMLQNLKFGMNCAQKFGIGSSFKYLFELKIAFDEVLKCSLSYLTANKYSSEYRHAQHKYLACPDGSDCFTATILSANKPSSMMDSSVLKNHECGRVDCLHTFLRIFT